MEKTFLKVKIIEQHFIKSPIIKCVAESSGIANIIFQSMPQYEIFVILRVQNVTNCKQKNNLNSLLTFKIR